MPTQGYGKKKRPWIRQYQQSKAFKMLSLEGGNPHVPHNVTQGSRWANRSAFPEVRLIAMSIILNSDVKTVL
ncbi:MAG: hypothetical protein VR64_00440 [Desulfatitalea sp. BRH_c12]|nr:MAG: hypothetical protein VR64_00440 [Desulfatitalea sp. BRH_c12]